MNRKTTLKIEIDVNTYNKYKKVVKGKNQMLKGYNYRIFEEAVKKELDLKK